ncbi:hypothetical protein J5N97_017974 [Dioscorea zingiberensis]|uniref:BHLH domain-containing protein n=1 Tax=Dioscorea zingiberensis TaxID=325984 RepID=A0A9D5HGV3_9LILI|nr:hypothetical protein J5N97_017974 [Dioscorea zingiberensis]
MDLVNIIGSTENQMELMNMMMQMEKLTEFSETSADHCSNGPHVSQFHNMPSINSSSPPPLLLNNNNNSNMLGLGGGTMVYQDNNQCVNLNGNWTTSTVTEKGVPMAAMREMIFRVAAMQPIHIDPETVKPPKRRNVRISKDPQSVAARHRRERISERIRILQRLVPGGTKMDTASMLDEAIHYVKFLKTQVQSLEWAQANRNVSGFTGGITGFSSANYPYQNQNFINSSQTMS